MQSRRASLIESMTNIAIGFVVSMLVWMLIVAPLYGLPNDAKTNFTITAIFTVTSIIRSYMLRRVFNAVTVYHYNKNLLEETNEAPNRNSREGAGG
jgi:hypothetical protein